MRKINKTILLCIALCYFIGLKGFPQITNQRNNQKGAPVVTASAAPMNICQGEQSILTAVGSLGTAPYSFDWSNGYTGDIQNVTPAVSTTYTVTITDNNGLSSTDQVTVTVFDLPVSGLYLSPTEICEGNSATLDANPSGGASPYGYSWNNGLSGNQSHTVSPAGNTNFSVTITDANGCTVEDAVTLTVHSNPIITGSATPPIACSGQSVTLDANSINDSSPYDYTWNGGLGNGQTHNINPTIDYTYTVSVTDANGCTAENDVLVSVYDLPNVTASAFPSALCALESGTLSASGSAGTGPYTYTWDNGLGAGQNQNIAPADTTTYTVTVTDANGCTSTDDITVNVWELPTPNLTASPNTICENTNSILNVTSTGGVSPYSYMWSDGLGVGDTHTVSPTSDETYYVTVADDNGCSSEANITVTVKNLPTVTASGAPNPVCSGETVNLTATGSGTTAPYFYFWGSGLGAGQNHTVNPTSTTNYAVTVTDGNGCTSAGSTTITTSDNPSPNPLASPNPICPGGSSSLSVSSTGGTSPYTYVWDNGLGAGDTHNVTPAGATTYTVTATDDVGCTGQASVLLDINTLPTINLSASPNPVCSGETSNITTTLTGGSVPFMFSWDNGLGNAQNPTVNPLVTTTYTLTVTDNNGCTSQESITLNVNDSPTVTATATPAAICPGQTTNLSATGSGGTAGYFYQWDNGIGPGANHTVSPSATTTYNVTITDAAGCTSTDQVTVTVYDEPVISLTAFPNPICALEISDLNASATGGTPAYTFTWDNGLGAGDHHVITPAANTTYTATVTDANGCQDQESILVQVTELPVVTAEGVPNPICEGETVILNAIGNQGTSPYSYTWNQGLGVGSTHSLQPTMTTTYSVTISDANGCTTEDDVTVTVWDLPTVTASASPNPICPGDATDLSATAGGTIPPYTFFWDNGLGLGANHNGITPASTTNYSVLVSDGHGCTVNQSVTVTVTDMPPANPTASPNPVCSGETVNLSVNGSGGTAPYTYTWDNGLGAGQNQSDNPSSPTTYSVTITDATGCTTSGSVLVDVYENPTSNLIADPNPICESGSTTLYPNPSGGSSPYSFAWDNGLPAIENPTASPLVPTNYHVTITDDNGCTTEDNVNVTIEPAPTVTADAIPIPVCSGEVVNLSATVAGTIAPYSYDWNNGLGLGQNQTDNPTIATTYEVTVTDGNGCTASNTVLVDVYELPTVTADASPNPICSGETVNLSAIGSNGLAPYAYTWNQGLGNGQNQTDNPLVTTNYVVTITDDNGCSSTDDIDVNVNDNPTPNLYANPNPICEGESATLFPDVSGGTSPYTYAWDNGLPAIQNPVVSPIVTTTYNLTVTDANGCTNTDQVVLDVSPAPTITISATPNSICPNTNSILSATGSGTTAPYDYNWSNGLGLGQSHTVSPSSTTTYYVTVTDATGCSAEDNITVTTFDEPSVIATAAPNPICSGETALLSATASGGSSPYSYDWPSIGAGQTQSVIPIISSTYTVTISDANGCTAEDDVFLSVNDLPTTNLTANPNPLCEGETSSLNLTVSNGTSPYSFAWNQGLGNMQNPNVTPLIDTYYEVVVTDAAGCTVSDNVTVTVNDQPTVSITASPSTICGGQNSTLTANGSGGTAPYTFAWDNGLETGGSQIVNPVNTTTYHVTITDDNGCENTAQVTVTVANSPDLLLTANPNPICSLESVYLSAFASSGTAPYTFDWDNGLGLGANHWDNPVSNTTYTVTVTDNTGCQDIESIEVQIFELPVVTAEGIPNPVCQGEPVNLNASSTNGLGPYSYEWNNGLGVGGSHTVNPASDETYIVTVTDANGCTAQDDVLIIVGDIPTITTTASPNPVCAGEPSLIETTGSGTVAPYTYFWGNGIGVGQSHTVNPVNDSTYFVSVTDGNGCLGSANITVNVYELPEANPIANPNPLCLGEDATLTVSGTSGQAPYTYTWDQGLGLGDTHTVSLATDQTYTVTIEDNNSCSNTASVDLLINPLPAITVSGTPNPVCGGEDAVISATANGTTPPYEYNWDQGLGLGQSHTVNPLVSTTYTVTATDANGCSVQGAITLDAYPAPSVTATATPNPICEGETSTLDAIGAGGSAPYNYFWDNGLGLGVTHNVSPANTTWYQVTLTDTNGCTANDSVELIVNPNPSLNITASPQVICEGENSTLTANTSGGNTPYSYVWNPALGPNDSYVVSPAVSSTYEVTVNDANGCSNTDQIIVTVNENPTVTLTAAPNPICYNTSTNLNTAVIGGTPAYTYLWSHSLADMPSHTVTMTSTDTYSVSVQDINGCEGTDNITINVNPEIVITVSNIVEPDCNGNSNASFEINVSGGTATYDIDWTNGSDNGNFLASAGGPHVINGIPAGNYQIDVTDAANCTETYNFTINEPDVLALNLDALNDILCHGETNGSVDYTISGGTANYTINWDNGTSTDNIPGLSDGSHTLSNLEAGNYDISLTDANGCQVVDNFTLIEPSALSFSVTGTSNVSCLNGANGSITVDISGGTADYDVTWDNGSTSGTESALSAGNHTISGLEVGNYNLTLTDQSGCTSTQTATLLEPATELDASILSIVDASCVGVNDGSAEIQVTGGVPAYIYTWDHANGSGTQITNVTAGDYHVTVTDDWGCQDSLTVTIGQPANGLSASPDVTPVSCLANSDGSITLNTAGGTAPYTYNWDPNVSSGETASNLASGDYDVTISDDGTCVLMLTINVPVDPNTLSAAITDTTHISCFGGNDGEIVVTASNGYPPYFYSWTGYPAETSNTLSNLTAGLYEMIVTDNLGCEIILSQNLNEPSQLSITEDSIHHVLCFGDASGDIYTSISGGTPPYSFSWEDDGGTDLGVNADDITGLPAGTYHIFVNDDNNCGPINQSFVITEPANALSVNITIDSIPSCPGLFDGGLTATGNGGTAPYTFLWDAPIAGNTNPTQTNLGANNYSVTITDTNGCTAENNITLNDPVALSINIITNDVLCFGEANGEAIAQVSGGSPNYTYLWEDALSNPVSLDDTASNLSTGNYFLTVTDANGCNEIASAVISEPDELTATTSQVNVSTWGNNDGSATVNPSDGTPTYSYEWENAAAPGVIISTNQTANNLSAGTYNITVTDSNGCEWTGSVIITEPNDPLGGNITLHQDVLCAPDSSGNLVANAFGGTPEYTYYWQDATASYTSNDSTFNNLPTGFYFLTVTDALGYTWDTTVFISEPPLLSITDTYQTAVQCYGDSTGSMSIDVSGGTPDYSYVWSDFSMDNDTLFNLPEGVYYVTVQDANGCEADTLIKLETNDSIQMDFLITSTPFCHGGNEGSLFVNMIGGAGPFTYYWEDSANNNISNTDTVVGLETGYYYLSVMDANGCVQNDSIFLPEPDVLTVSLDGVDATGFGASDAYAWALEVGGTSPYFYNWEDILNPGINLATTDTLWNVHAGTYSLTLTDDNGCTTEDQITLNEPDELLHTIIGSNVHCYGDSTGGAWIQVTGGIQPYTYSWEDASGTEIWTDSVMIFIPAGEYFVTATDANGYTTFDSITIIEPPALYFGLDSVQNALCFGDNSAYIDLNPTGGTLPYILQWINTADPGTPLDTDDFIENIGAGEYMLTIVDDSTCVYDTIINIMQPDSLEVILETQGDITCFGDNNGFIQVDVFGGMPPYQYEWLDETNTTFETGVDSVGNLAYGNYTLIVSDANNCTTDSLNYFINEPLPFNFSATIDSVYCFGESTGSVQLNLTGGTPDFIYQWLYEGDSIDNSNFPTLFNLEAGQYDIYVTDNNGCNYDTTLNVLEPASAPSLSLTLSDSIECYAQSDAEVTVQINGGTSNYSLFWTNGSGGDGELENIIAGTHIITGIEAGNFTFILTDANGCSETQNMLVPEPDEIVINLLPTHISCFGNDDGVLQSIVTGGNPPYFYTWDGNPMGTDTAAVDLTPGWHSLEITDNNGCTDIDSSFIHEPLELTIDLRDTLPLNCYGDANASTIAAVSGGIIPYSIYWTNETGDTINNSAYITDLGAGMYYVHVNDANGCSLIDSTFVFEPNPLSASTESFMTSCPASADGYAVIHMDANAGTPPYEYDWNNPEHSVTDTAVNLNAGWWYVTVTDTNNCVYLDSVEIFSPDSLLMSFATTPVQCNDVPGSVVISTIGGTPSYEYDWSTGDSTGIVPNIAAGIHTVTVTDLHGCTWAQQVMVESVGNLNPEIVVTQPISCYGSKDGELTAIVNEGALPFTFDWNTGNDTQSIDELFAGTYFVEVIDNWGCIGHDTLTLTQPESIILDFITQDVLCRDGNSGWAQAIASGGNGNFSYAWDAQFYGNPYTNLSKGYYSVVATDQEGCNGMGTVYIDEPDSSIYALAEVRDVTCYGYNNGRAIAQGFGGQAPYHYMWYGPGNDTIYQQQTGATLFPGNYNLVVTDDNGCRYDSIIKIRQPSPIYIDMVGYGSPSCNGLEDGYIELDSITGGTPPYTIFINGAGISWTQQNPYIDSIPAGHYIVNVYDVNQCLQNNDAVIVNLAESEEDCIRIPAAFSPNGDGFNDEWQIDHLDLYRRCLIQVYNRWGQLLYEGGWDDPFWDGTYDGNPVPTGAYIYYVNLGTNSRKPLTGTVTIIR